MSKKTTQGFVMQEGPHKAWWPVSIEVPVDGGPETAGQTQIHKISLYFEACDEEEFKAIQPASNLLALLEPDSEKLVKDIDEFLAEKVSDWHDVTQVKNKKATPLKFSKAKFKNLMKKAFVKSAVLKAYVSFLSGSASKN